MHKAARAIASLCIRPRARWFLLWDDWVIIPLYCVSATLHGKITGCCGPEQLRNRGIYRPILLYKRLNNGAFQWPRTEQELRLLDARSFRWLMEGLKIDQPKAIQKEKSEETKIILYFPIILARRFFRVNIFLTIQCLIFSTGQLDWQTMAVSGHFDQAFVSNRTGRLGKSCKPAWYQGKTGHKGKNRGVKNRFAELRVFYTLFLIWDIVKFGIRRASLSVIRGELWHLMVNKTARDISHNSRVMTSHG